MDILNMLHKFFDGETEHQKKNLITKGIGYEMSYDVENAFVLVKLFGDVRIKLIEHLKDQLQLCALENAIEYLLIDFSEAGEVTGSIWKIRKGRLPQTGIEIKKAIILLPDWSHKKKLQKLLVFLGLQQLHFFFSSVSAFNWIRANR